MDDRGVRKSEKYGDRRQQPTPFGSLTFIMSVSWLLLVRRSQRSQPAEKPRALPEA